MEVGWRPGIGDPSIIGWLTVGLYAAASILTLVAANRAQFSGLSWRRDGVFWVSLALLMLALGINKQIDLQTLFTEVVRNSAIDGGWYEDRRGIQEFFIAAIISLGLFTTILLAAGLWRSCLTIKFAAAGMCFLICFIVIRAASFHDVDKFLGSELGGARWNWIIEILGILMIAIAAQLYSMRMKLNQKRPRIPHLEMNKPPQS